MQNLKSPYKACKTLAVMLSILLMMSNKPFCLILVQSNVACSEAYLAACLKKKLNQSQNASFNWLCAFTVTSYRMTSKIINKTIPHHLCRSLRTVNTLKNRLTWLLLFTKWEGGNMKRHSDSSHATAPLGMETISQMMWKEGQNYPCLALKKCLVLGWTGNGEMG